jgi:thiol-disulfide isomerase/thioredoxin
MRKLIMILLLFLSFGLFAQDFEHLIDFEDNGSLEGAAELAETNTVVLFFYADWCPTCISALEDLADNDSLFPEDLFVVVVPYDDNRDLRRQFNVVRQHTFVQIDASGEKVKLWNGGDYGTMLRRLNIQ